MNMTAESASIKVPSVNHLNSAGQFQAVMNAEMLAQSPHFAMHRLSLLTSSPLDAITNNPTSQPLMFQGGSYWVGVVVSKRNAKKAVRRNLLRRQIYQVAKESSNGLDNGAHVVRLRRPFDAKEFKSASSDLLKKVVRAELLELFAKTGQRVQSPSTIRPLKHYKPKAKTPS
jgi:ribonuclease P protein component